MTDGVMRWWDRVDWRWFWGAVVLVAIIANGVCATYAWNQATPDEQAELQDAQCLNQPC